MRLEKILQTYCERDIRPGACASFQTSEGEHQHAFLYSNTEESEGMTGIRVYDMSFFLVTRLLNSLICFFLSTCGPAKRVCPPLTSYLLPVFSAQAANIVCALSPFFDCIVGIQYMLPVRNRVDCPIFYHR